MSIFTQDARALIPSASGPQIPSQHAIRGDLVTHPPISSSCFTELSSINEISPNEQRLLEEFNAAAWGNEIAFEQRHGDIKFLDLSGHFEAIELIFPSFPRHGRILIREEYEEAEKVVRQAKIPYHRGMVVNGQAGIGKTLFSIYFTVKCLGRREPVAYQARGSYTLFSESGVLLWPIRSAVLIQRLQCTHVWAVFDCNPFSGLPPAYFLTSKIRLVVTASPNVIGLRKWFKETGVKPYILDIWNDAEMAHLAIILGLDEHEILRLASKYGPIPRTLLELYDQDTEHSLYCNLQSIARSTMQSMPDVLDALENSRGTESSPLIFIRPGGTALHDRLFSVPFLPTPIIYELLVDQATKADWAKQEAFFDLVSRHPSTRGPSEDLFEKLGHLHFRGGHSINCTWIPPSSSPSHVPLSTNIPDSNVRFLATQDRMGTIQPPWYWHPSSPNHGGIDGALAVGNTVYAIQFTIASTHSSPMDGVARLRQLVPQYDVRLLFVGEDQAVISNIAFREAASVYNTVQTRQRSHGPHPPVLVGYAVLPVDTAHRKLLQLAQQWEKTKQDQVDVEMKYVNMP